MSSHKRQLSSNAYSCESEECDFVGSDERALAIHANSCSHIRAARQLILTNAQQNHRAKRTRLFGISAAHQGARADSESADSSGSSDSTGRVSVAESMSALGSSEEPGTAYNPGGAGEESPQIAPTRRQRRVKKPPPPVPHLTRVVPDTLPQPPIVEEPSTLQLDMDRTGHFETLPDSFGVFRRYHSRPYTIPDQMCELENYSNKEYENGGDIMASEKDIRDIIWPCPNISTFLVQHWHWVEGGNKTRGSRDSLVNKVLLDPRFKLEHIRGISWVDLDEQLKSKGSSGLSAGWNAATLHVKIPSYWDSTSSTIAKFPIPNFQYRTLIEVMTEAFTYNDPMSFHYEPFELRCLVSTSPIESQQLYGEMYNSKAMLELHDEIQRLPPEPGCNLPRVVAAFMFSSDGAQVAQFSTTNVHPVYCYFGNQSKYERCKPSSNTCFDIAHIPPLPDSVETFLGKLAKDGKTTKNLAMLAHLRRELMHEVWGKLLDDQFVDAWVHGFVIKCADGIKRRVYPRILTYSADYPERVLLTTIRNMGNCACPRCLMPKLKFKFVGQQNDIKFRMNHPRVDDEDRQHRTNLAWTLLYSKGKKLNSKPVEQLLQPQSLVPTKNAFSLRLRQHGFDYHKMMVVDFMHDIELGVWKNMFTHLMRIIQASGSQVETEFNTRFRAVAPFGPSTINCFSNNMSEMKKLAARDYEDMLQCCIPVFKGLLPKSISKRVLDLLFIMAHWHSLGKLRIHSEKTITIFQNVTKELCTELRAFARYTSEYNNFETRKEKEARQRRESKRSGSASGHSSNPKTGKGFSLDTYKIHSIVDYTMAIPEYGTTDSYSTQIGELQHRRIKGLFGRTNKQKDTTSQITSMERTQNALRRMGEELEPLFTPRPSQRPSSAPKDMEILAKSTRYHHYDIAVGQKDFIHLPTWLSHRSNDPSTHLFFSRLRSHLFSRLDPTGTRIVETHHGFQIQHDRLYKHAIMGVNYTSYDMRRCTDCIHPSTERQFVLVQTPDATATHPFYYARVLGIFHANVCLNTCEPFQRVEFLWVRWLAHDPSSSGWKTKRLDRLSYYSEDPDDTESSPPLDFICPSDVVRAVHLIPAFDAGTTREYLPGSSVMAHDIAEEGDWKYWYAMRFVDRDMMMRYHGEGIGHHSSALERDESTEVEVDSEGRDMASDEDGGELDTTKDPSVVDIGENVNEEDENGPDSSDDSGSQSTEEYESEDDMEPLQYEY